MHSVVCQTKLLQFSMRSVWKQKRDAEKGRERPAKKRAQQGLAKLAAAFKNLFLSKKRRTSWGGTRNVSNSSPGERRSFEGFLYEPDGIAKPDPPKTPSRNKKQSIPHALADVGVVDTPVAVSTRSSEPRRPAGRPPMWKAYRLNGKDGFWLSSRQKNDLLEKDLKQHFELKRVKAKLAKAKAKLARFEKESKKKLKVPKSAKVAVAALLQAKRVSASNVPDVIAICSYYLTGRIRPEHLMAASTVLDYTRDAGEVCRQRLLTFIGKHKLPFFIGSDMSNRGGAIASYLISYLWESKPVKKFFTFERMEDKGAEAIADGIARIARLFEKSGGIFYGISSDGPNVMVGIRGGVGIKLSEKFHKYIRHDRCEHHASACVLRVLESVWPAQLGVESVTQLGYLCWYILNEDWDMYRAYMIEFIEDSPVPENVAPHKIGRKELLKRFSSGPTGIQEAKKMLVKPDKPTGSRWRTLSNMIIFIWRFREALRWAFDRKRCLEGVGGSTPGSIAAMCGQWIKWCSSWRLVALCEIAREFIISFWKPHDDKISLRDLIYGCSDSFKVFTRPMRALLLVESVNAWVKQLEEGEMPPSFEKTVEAFGEEKREEVKQLYLTIYRRAKNAVHHNYGPYLQGMLVMAGVADPEFLPILWEAMSHWKGHKRKSLERSKKGKLLQEWLSETEQLNAMEKKEFQIYSSPAHLDHLYQLFMLVRSDGGAAKLVHMMKESAPENPLAFVVSRWAGAMSHTQAVERSFLDWDQMNDNSLGRNLKKATVAPGKKTRADVTSARTLFRTTLTEANDSTLAKHVVGDVAAEVEDEDLEDKPAPKKSKKARLTAKKDVIRVMEKAFEEMTYSKAELSDARSVTKRTQSYLQKPRLGVAPEMIEVLAMLDQTVAGWEAPQKDLAILIAEGEGMDVSLETLCSATCLKNSESRRGNPGLLVQCCLCSRNFHVKCLQADGSLSKTEKLTKEVVKRLRYCCAECKIDVAEDVEELEDEDEADLGSEVEEADTQPFALSQQQRKRGRNPAIKENNARPYKNPRAKEKKNKKMSTCVLAFLFWSHWTSLVMIHVGKANTKLLTGSEWKIKNGKFLLAEKWALRLVLFR